MAYYIAEGAVVKGQVTMADGASVWYNATVRGDSEPIEIGRNSNIQDNAVVHVDLSHSVRIGNNVTIGLEYRSIGELSAWLSSEYDILYTEEQIHTLKFSSPTTYYETMKA